MCGIYGSTKIYSKKLIEKKLNRINFRGPDFSGIEIIDNKVVFGHNRLAVIDLDPRSNQPLFYKNVCIVFNGEIYNFNLIKDELIGLGYVFTTKSDTELICASYLEWGLDCVKKFIGMFSFVIYDKKNEILYGARDRLGKKPFYYTLSDNCFEFSSQLSPLSIGNNFSVSENSVSQFLRWSNIPEPHSIYNEVEKLKPGHYFTYHINKHNFCTRKYWDFDDERVDKTISYEDAKQRLNDLIVGATAIRMIADVPLGIFLSGGIDSSLIAAVAQKNSKTPIKTFSIKFTYDSYDESPYAEKIAKYIGSDHKTIVCDSAEAISLINDYHNYFDEPFGDSSAIPTMLLAKRTREYVTVALSGDGGDEGFLGYTRYNWIDSFNRLKLVPFFIKNMVGKTLAHTKPARLKAIGTALSTKKTEDIYKSFLSVKDLRFLSDPAKSDCNEFEERLYSRKNILERVSDYDIKSYLNNDINTKVDRATMAFSLECRAPLMDHRIIEFSRILPTAYKLSNGVKKKILKDILADYIPRNLFDRPKAGFGAPIAHWFRQELKDYVYEVLTEHNLTKIPNLNIKYIKKAIDNHMT
ncbi:MAG: asparagine synthase (glutamine-hydrolyzing), partial [Bacteroidota bacterium]|nr:asparagine synthase (glutamine-hydrolyzing) [Bacteroidota bacterium]